MLKRSTAMTNSNSQSRYTETKLSIIILFRVDYWCYKCGCDTLYISHVCSRSQCIINIRCASNNLERGVDVQMNSAVLTIVDLAGAEREKRTGNQVQYFCW